MNIIGFQNEEDILSSYEAPADALKDATLIFAMYGGGSYDGYSFILFHKDGKYYEVNGAHCSCYGLEGQWNPEETDIAFLEMRFFNDGPQSYMFCDHPEAKEALRHALFGVLIDKEYFS
jgi:hypothetical protein